MTEDTDVTTKGTLTQHVGEGKFCHLMYYQGGYLWYRADSGLEFPVSVEDAGTGLFGLKEKSIFCMRWIRKHLENIEKGKTDEYSAHAAEMKKVEETG